MTKFNPCPKRKPYRDPNLLAMAKGRIPILNKPGYQVHHGERTVACHSNFLEHGKGKSQKAHDFFTVWGTSEANMWFDFDKDLTRVEREVIFDEAHRKQILEWEKITNEPCETEPSKKSASKALEAFGLWIYENKWRFSDGDWQLEYIKCPDCTEYQKDAEYAGYSNGCVECEKRMRGSTNEKS